MTLLDRQDWRDGAPAHTACALGALALSPDVAIVAEPGFAKAHLPVQNAAKAMMIKYEQKSGMLSRDWNGFERRAAPFLNTLGLHFATDGYVPVRRGPARDFLAWGYFQGEAYFADAADAIRRELLPRFSPPFETKGTPVCVHLRRGDYQNPENAILQVCTPGYYARAVQAVKERCPDAVLYVFSDDVAWAQDNLDAAGLETVFLPRGDAAQDLDRMRRCRHFILSNSTYSWWAQYLCDAPDKLVLVPDRWYAHTKQTALYQQGMTRIPCGG